MASEEEERNAIIIQEVQDVQPRDISLQFDVSPRRRLNPRTQRSTLRVIEKVI